MVDILHPRLSYQFNLKNQIKRKSAFDQTAIELFLDPFKIRSIRKVDMKYNLRGESSKETFKYLME